MARTRSISSIETEISKVEKDLAKVQARYDSLATRLLELQQKRRNVNPNRSWMHFIAAARACASL